MIPRGDLGPLEELDFEKVATPHRGWIEYPSWLGTQRDYDPDLHAEAGWDRVAELLNEERAALAQIDAGAANFAEFDELAFESFEAEGQLFGLLELGVTSLVYALNAAGCVSASSCRGHPGRGPETPWVMFAGSVGRIELIAELAKGARARVVNEQNGGITIVAPSVVEAIALAEVLLMRASSFDRMSPLC